MRAGRLVRVDRGVIEHAQAPKPKQDSSLAEDLACLHDVLEGDKVLYAPVQPDLAPSGRGIRLCEVQGLP